MKQSEAIQHLRETMWGLQKYRSIAMETWGPGTGDIYLSEELAAEEWPWVFGKKCPLPALMKILDAVDNGKDLSPANYYNMMTVLYRFMPEVAIAAGLLEKNSLPKEQPGIDVLLGWERE